MGIPSVSECAKDATIDHTSIPPRRQSQRIRAGSSQAQRPVDDQGNSQNEELSTNDAPVALSNSTSPVQGRSGGKPIHPLIPHIRESSRLLVRELGFMSSTVAGTDLPPSAVHAIIEIGSSSKQVITASSLCQILNLEKSSVSRMLRKLVEKELVTEAKSAEDGREKVLELTEKGGEILGEINEFAEEQVGDALDRLPGRASAETVLEGIRIYAEAFRGQRMGDEVASVQHKPERVDINIVSGYRPGLLGRCLEMHMAYYSPTVGFGSSFEAMLATGLGDLCVRLDGQKNEVWVALSGERIIGTIWIDGQDLGIDGKKAHLRAFIVADEARGGGIGRKLIERAMEFVEDKGFEETHLWTFKGLEAARRLYVEFGFVTINEKAGKRWGKEVVERHFVRKIGGAAASSGSEMKVN